MALKPDDKLWLRDFVGQHGRPPRVLHIGNIANNAYNNAKLLNQAGLDCDVICYDYYHVMGCPEWEEADVSGEFCHDDQFFPDWTKADLQGYDRPAWFVQGALRECIEYLVARREGNRQEAVGLWLSLLSTCKRTRSSLWERCRASVRTVYGRFYGLARKILCADPSIVFTELLQATDRRVPGESRLLVAGLLLIGAAALRAGGLPLKAIVLRLRKRRRPSLKREERSLDPDELWDELVDRLIRLYDWEFPERTDKLVPADLLPYKDIWPAWNRVLSLYDFVIGYSTDPIIPMLCDRPYFAFEHGTIREIPYYATAQGRLTALAYRRATHVFVTNFDCIKSAMHLAPRRFTLINHPYDEDHGLGVAGWEEQRERLMAELDSTLLFFHPTRHDWVPNTGYADKSNDVFLRAFGVLRKEGHKVGLICCNWGGNVAQSKELLDEIGCSAFVRWMAPMPIVQYERMCRSVDIVVDQFKLGAFGGITFKAMAVGTPILMYLDERSVRRQYEECPPVFNCATSEEIVSLVRKLLDAPGEIKAKGKLSRDWMKTYHSKQQIIDAQLAQFRLPACQVAGREGAQEESYAAITPRCHIPWQQMVIDSTGAVSPCAYHGGYGNFNSNMGNLNDQTIEEIWNGENYRSLRRHMAAGDLVSAGCANCYALKEGLELGLDYDRAADFEIGPVTAYAKNIGILKSEVSRGATVLRARPTVVSYTPSHRCNLRCIHCYQTATRTAEMSRASAETDILRLSPYLVRLIAGGGEPFLLSIWKKFLASFDTSANPYLEFATTTNATLIDDSMIRDLRRFKTVAISISLDATGALYEAIRVGSAWPQVLQNVRRLKALIEESESERSAIAITICIMKSTILHLPDFVRFALAEGLPFSVSPVVTMPPNENLLCLNGKPVDEMKGWLDALAEATDIVRTSTRIDDQARFSYIKRFDMIVDLIKTEIDDNAVRISVTLQLPDDELKRCSAKFGQDNLVAYLFPIDQRGGTAPYWAPISRAGTSAAFLPYGRYSIAIADRWNYVAPEIRLIFSVRKGSKFISIRKIGEIERTFYRVYFRRNQLHILVLHAARRVLRGLIARVRRLQRRSRKQAI